jgi:hypothetical protein
MEIPESVSKLLEESNADSLIGQKKTEPLQLEQIIHEIKRILDYKDSLCFDQGLSFYKKDISSEKLLIKNVIALLGDHFTRNIRQSSIPDLKKDEAINVIIQTLRGMEAVFESQYNLLNILNNEKNLLDARSLIMIMFGYVIGNLRKLYIS